jgi:hypothetical protein
MDDSSQRPPSQQGSLNNIKVSEINYYCLFVSKG